MPPVILFYSFTGNNRLLAETLAGRIGCSVVEVTETRPRKPLRIAFDLALRRFPPIAPFELPDYDRLIVIAPLWNRWIAHPMRTALRGLGRGIGPYAFASFSGGVRPGQVDFVDDQLLKLTGRAAEKHWALYVEELVPEKIRGTPLVSDYRVKPEELTRYPEVDEIVAWATG